MTKRDGGSAFPRIDWLERGDSGRTDVICASGMTLRDYFAGQALAGLHASPNRKAAFIHEDDATFCYCAADAMLAARAHQEGEE